MTAGIVPWVGGFGREGRLWDSYNAFRPGEPELVGVIGLDRDLVPVDSLLAGPVEEEVFETPAGGTTVREHIPFTPWITWKFDPRGYLFVGDARAYRIHQLTTTGDTVRRVELEHRPVPVLSAELDSALAGLDGYRNRGGVVDPSLIPRNKPALQAIYVGSDGRIWSMLHVEGDAIPPGPSLTRFDVFSGAGVHLGVAEAPLRLEAFTPPPVFGPEHVHAVATDELDVPYVVRLRIEPSG